MSESKEAPGAAEEVSAVSVLFEAEQLPKADPTLQSRRDPPRSEPISRPPPFSDRPPLVAGCLVGGRYRLQRKVGSGGMGEVWAAEHLSLHTEVAVKVLLPRALQVPEIVARFEREAFLLGRVRGDHAPHPLDFFVDETYGPVLVTELVDGESLADVIKTPLTVEQAVAMGIQLATAVDELHRARVVHRDLKPSNIILRHTADGSTRATIIDFGVGRLVDESEDSQVVEITSADVVVGTIEYMAPEQIVPCGAVTPGADLYALGALLFRAVSGSHVFGADLGKLDVVRAKLANAAPPLPTGRDDSLSHGLAAVVARALERTPAARYQSALELRSDLLRLLDPAPAPRARVEERVAPGGARRRVAATIAAVTLLVSAGACVRMGGGETKAPSIASRPEPVLPTVTR